jgi:hypothetical protein
MKPNPIICVRLDFIKLFCRNLQFGVNKLACSGHFFCSQNEQWTGWERQSQTKHKKEPIDHRDRSILIERPSL